MYIYNSECPASPFSSTYYYHIPFPRVAVCFFFFFLPPAFHFIHAVDNLPLDYRAVSRVQSARRHHALARGAKQRHRATKTIDIQSKQRRRTLLEVLQIFFFQTFLVLMRSNLNFFLGFEYKSMNPGINRDFTISEYFSHCFPSKE